MAGYTKEFLVEAFVSRYVLLGVKTENAMRNMANDFYDKVGRDRFRVYATIDAEAIKEYKKYI
jgi:hypothetical protein